MSPLILVVDDEPVIQQALEVVLTHKGYQYAKCLTGEEAFKMMEDVEFNLVILDLNLPDIHGRKIAEYIDNNHPNTPIVFITADHSAEAISLENECKGRGDRRFIYKPITSDAILSAINNLTEESLRKGMPK